IAEIDSPQPQAVEERPEKPNYMFAHEALFLLASAVGTPLQVDKETTDEKKKDLSLQQTGKDQVTLSTLSIINSGKSSVDNLNKDRHTITTIQERVDTPNILLHSTATSGHKEDTEAMLLRTLISKISEQLVAAATGSSTPVHIDVEAQNSADNNSRELIVTLQVATQQLLSRFVKHGELGTPIAVVVT
ncbi:hypothetical protein EJD97_007190, partial [Solanum chilense]